MDGSGTMSIRDGQVVTLEYTVTLDDGTVLDSTGRCGPIAVMYGSGQLFPALEDRLAELAVGETREFVIPAEQAYGPWHPDLVREIPRSRLDPGLSLEVGQDYRLRSPEGPAVRFRLVAIGDTTVRADFNDPRAGKALRAVVTIVAVREPTPEEERRGRV
jgi:FKBP-type peptidyl-prolyl cis-trans isomerase 2